MEEYKSNSHKSKEQSSEGNKNEKNIQKVISGSAKTKKKSGIQKFTDVFVSEDVGDVKSYILTEVLVPAIKRTISDIVTNGIDIIFYGEAGRSKKNTPASKVSYGGYYKKEDEHRTYRSNRVQSGFDYDDIMFETRGDAEIVLDTMNDIIDQYGIVSVGDLYELADISVDNYTVNKYGWKDLQSASVVRVRDAWMLKLPKALPFN